MIPKIHHQRRKVSLRTLHLIVCSVAIAVLMVTTLVQIRRLVKIQQQEHEQQQQKHLQYREEKAGRRQQTQPQQRLLPSGSSRSSSSWYHPEIKEVLECEKRDKTTTTALALFCTLDDIKSREEKEVLAEIWRLARKQIPRAAELRKVLSMAVPLGSTLLGKKVELWAPAGDIGLTTVLGELNGGNSAAEYGVADWKGLLGLGKVFVDVGSNLGLVSLSVLLAYPGTKVLSVEAAAPTYVYQLLNLGRNLPPKAFREGIRVVPAGLGRKDGESFAMTWRPYSTTSTRSWTPGMESRPSVDIELQVPILTWSTVLGDAGVTNIDVCKVDCEGCEYNVIPGLTDAQFDAIGTIVGEIHWGFIPDRKKPPSDTLGRATHERLCRHENFAKQAKECCSIPEAIVGGKGGGPSVGLTVRKVAGSLCDNFDAWAKKTRLFDIRPDETEWDKKDSSVAK